MPPKKTGITLEQHRELGAELFQMRERLTQISGELSRAYPVSVSALAHDVWEAIDALRSTLGDKVSREHPTNDEVLYFYSPR